MRHLKRGRKFGRRRSQRVSLLRTLGFQLIMRERIITSEAKAKEIRPFVEKMVTMARGSSLASRRILLERLPLRAVQKLTRDIAPRYQNRSGGYTRIMKIGARASDSSQQAMIEFVQ